MATPEEIAKARADLKAANTALANAKASLAFAVTPSQKYAANTKITDAGVAVRKAQANLDALLKAPTPAADPTKAQNNSGYNFPNNAGAGQGNRGVIQNRANDDKTNKKKTGKVKQTPVQPAISVSTVDGYDNRFARLGTAGPTQAGKVETPEAKSNKYPDRRRYNPLSAFSSYTFQVSLYMITPDAYEAFINSGRKNLNAIVDVISEAEARATNDVNTSNNAPTRTIGSPPASSSQQTTKKGGAYLVAQSGGINNNGTNSRAPGFELDFYIDDIVITQAISAKETQSSTNVTEMTFKITEPYGFSFLTKLKQAQLALAASCPTPGYENLTNPTKQFYILGLRFLGYDQAGNVLDGTKLQDNKGTGVGVFERYYDVILSKLDFKLGGQSVVYNCTALSLPGSQAFGQKKGVVWSGASITANTVYDALMGGSEINPSTVRQVKPGEDRQSQAGAGGTAGSWGLLSTLNKEQQKRLKNNEIEYASEWNVVFKPGAEKIKNATILTKADIDKRRNPTSTTATNTTKSNAAVAQKNEQPNMNLRNIDLGKGISIIQAVEEIVKQSSFIDDAQTILMKSETDNSIKGDGSPDIIQNSAKTVEISWYNITAEVVVIAWDNKQSDFVYRTTFIIQTYKTPVTTSSYAGKTSPYYGPHKQYQYWYTGKNTEVLKFEQTFNNAFFNVAVEGAGVSPNASAGPYQAAVIPGQPNGGTIQGRTDSKDLQTQNSYISSLYDPGAWAETQMTIIGDPDFLMQPAASSIIEPNTDWLIDQFYGTDGYTVSPNGGQVFVELNFKEPNDYDNNTGTMNINQYVNIYPHPTYIQKDIDSRGNGAGGIALMLTKVVSKFNKGSFQQDLTAIAAVFPPGPEELAAANAAANANRENQSNAETNRLAGKTPINTNSGTGAAATTSAAKVNQTNVRTGSPTSLNGLSYTKNAALMAPYKTRAQTGSAPNPSATATSVKSMATAETVNRGTNTGVNKGKLNPWDRSPNLPGSKPIQNQKRTIPTKNGESQDDDAGNDRIPGIY